MTFLLGHAVCCSLCLPSSAGKCKELYWLINLNMVSRVLTEKVLTEWLCIYLSIYLNMMLTGGQLTWYELSSITVDWTTERYLDDIRTRTQNPHPHTAPLTHAAALSRPWWPGHWSGLAAVSPLPSRHPELGWGANTALWANPGGRRLVKENIIFHS